MKKILVSLLLATVVFPIGCSRLQFGLDESNLEKVVEFYYSPGNPPPDGKKTYRLLSSKSRTQITEEQWVQLASRFEKSESVKVLRKEDLKGITYGLDSLEENHTTGKVVATTTWILEDNKWRRLFLPKTQEEVGRAFQNGDYPAAKAKAEEWLSLDPFSVDAYYKLALSIQRSGIRTFNSGDRSLSDIVRAVLAINENDSTVLSLAVWITEDVNIAKTFLKRLEGHKVYTVAAYNLASDISNPNERLLFLEGQKKEANILMLRLRTLAELKRWDDFRKLSNEKDIFTSIKYFLDKRDPSFAAGNAGLLGLGAHMAGDNQTAQRWLGYGVMRDPNSEAVRKLASALPR